MLRLGWKAGVEQYPPNELLDQVVAADRAGFDSVDASDHFHPWSDDGQASFVWTWLGAAAVKTERIRLGTGVTCPILRYNPAIIAQAAATLAVIAPGRVYLGVGTGEALNEYASTGMWPEYDDRQDMLEEAIVLMRELWSGQPVTHRGPYFETDKARLYTHPDGQIPILISSMVPDSATFAGRLGDGLFTVGGEQPDVYKQILKNFDEAAEKAGQDPAQMPKAIELNVAYTDDEQAAIECQKKYWAGTFIPALFDQKIYTPAMSARNGASVGSDTIKQKVLISGNPDDHVKLAQEYIDLGFNELYFHCAGPDQIAFIEGFGRDVLPHIRQANGSSEALQRETIPSKEAATR